MLLGSQLNNLYAHFEVVQDQAARELLYRFELECCWLSLENIRKMISNPVTAIR